MEGTYETHMDRSAGEICGGGTQHQHRTPDYFNIFSVLDRASGYMDRLVKEAIQIRLNQNNFNRDSGFTLSRAWNPVTKLLFKHDTDPSKAAIEPAHRSQPVTDLSRKGTGPGVNWTECSSQPLLTYSMVQDII
jgi:hypothetical protein